MFNKMPIRASSWLGQCHRLHSDTNQHAFQQPEYAEKALVASCFHSYFPDFYMFIKFQIIHDWEKKIIYYSRSCESSCMS